MPGLRLILTSDTGERAAAAIEAAASWAALGRPVHLLLRGTALQLAPETITMLHDLGATITACQTAMAQAGITAADLPAHVAAGGMLAFLSGHEDWQLILA